jgi:hypothetical protein
VKKSACRNSGEPLDTYTVLFQFTFARRISLPGCSAIVAGLGAINDSFRVLNPATLWLASSMPEKVDGDGGGLISAIRTPTVGPDMIDGIMT